MPLLGGVFQARWESLLCDFSTARLLHSLLPIATDPRQTLGVVAPHAMRPIAQAQRSIQVLMQGHRTPAWLANAPAGSAKTDFESSACCRGSPCVQTAAK